MLIPHELLASDRESRAVGTAVLLVGVRTRENGYSLLW